MVLDRDVRTTTEAGEEVPPPDLVRLPLANAATLLLGGPEALMGILVALANSIEASRKRRRAA